MKVGTKSVLFGAHCFLWHPLFVAIAWIKLYGWTWDPRIWIAFVVHDLGYWGKPNMDGPEGELHVEFGARVMHRLFDRPKVEKHVEFYCTRLQYEKLFKEGWIPYYVRGAHLFFERKIHPTAWRDFCLYHSRYYAKKDDARPSQLCFADKLSICLTPWWLYLPAVNATGEIKEYLKNAQYENQQHWKPISEQKEWFSQLQDYMRKWIEEHIDGSEDTWTDPNRNKALKSGVNI